jgi:hypothetical protein
VTERFKLSRREEITGSRQRVTGAAASGCCEEDEKSGSGFVGRLAQGVRV